MFFIYNLYMYIYTYTLAMLEILSAVIREDLTFQYNEAPLKPHYPFNPCKPH